MLFVMAAGLALLALGLVVPPLLKGPQAATENVHEQELAFERERVFGALRELEYDRAMGKLDEQDYAEMQKAYTGKAVNLLKNEQAALAEVDALLEQEIASERNRLSKGGRSRVSGAAARKGSGFCMECGAHLVKEHQTFCHQCGAPTGKGVATQ